MMNAPQPVIITSPVVQGQQVQQRMTSQPQVVYMQAPSSPQLQMENSQRGCVVGMGVMQLIFGIFIFLAQISAFIIFTTLTTYAAPGTWSGIFFIIAGAFGIAGGRKKSKGLVITSLVMSIISACVAVAAIILAAISLALDDDTYEDVDGAAVAIDAMLLTLGIVGFVFAISSSGVGCGVLCCCTRNQVQPGTVFVHPSFAGATHPQLGHPIHQWPSAPGTAASAVQPAVAGVSYPHVAYPTHRQWQHGPTALVAGPYPPQVPAPYSAPQEPSKQDVAGVHGVSATQPPSDDPPPYNLTTTDGMYN